MNKKFELTSETKIVFGITVYRIRARVSFGNVNAGELGGYIEKEKNLDHIDNAWVSGDACVFGNACVSGDADYFCVKGAGSQNRNTTFFKCEDGVILVNAGCFCGTLAEFAAKVHETHGGTKYEREYNAAIELVKIHFGLDDVNDVVKDAAESVQD